MQDLAWVAGTPHGVVIPSLDAAALGLDAVVPAFFCAILIGERRDRQRTSRGEPSVGIARRVR